ncbi:hypothetical protein A3Q56_02493 [Intoshia linei]|uniref:Thymidylate synthase n=1 Tax=Intoshia linei TaxID=1819745 RepID=A0A177B8K1_9BILA|nr:hypothetical protein A3Q56_02493 [Intoshia linei]
MSNGISKSHDEYQYLRLIENIMTNGTQRSNRTGTDTLSIFGAQSRYDLSNGVIPVLTTKRVFWRGVVEELLWIIAGCTNSNVLTNRNVKIWDQNGSREFLDNLGFKDRKTGDLGPVYGFQWRHFGAKYKTCDDNYDKQGVDQLANVIHLIKNDPDSRRIVLSSWNAMDLPDMALPPCHCLCQFYVCNNKLSCQLYQRSADMGLGVPFNIASYSLLTFMLAHITNTEPGEFIHTIGDAHVYVNHVEPLKQQIVREPYQFPNIEFLNPSKIVNIDDFTMDNIVLKNYQCHKPIKMDMANDMTTIIYNSNYLIYMSIFNKIKLNHIAKNCALLICDVQTKFEPHIKNFDIMTKNCQKLMTAAKLLNVPIYVTEHYPKGLGNIVPELSMKDVNMYKKTLFSMAIDELVQDLNKNKDIQCINICGLETHVCVQQSVFDFLDLGYAVDVVVDAVGSRSLLDRSIGIRRMENCGANLTTTESLIFTWCQNSTHQNFKQIQKLVVQQNQHPDQLP